MHQRVIDANPILGGVLCHLFLCSRTTNEKHSVEDPQIKTENERWVDRQARSAVAIMPCLPFLPLSPFFFFSDQSYAICSPISHFHSLISHGISLHALDKDRAPHLCLILEHLPLPDDAPLWGIRCSQEFLCELGQKASVFLYRCLVPEMEIGLNNTVYLLF